MGEEAGLVAGSAPASEIYRINSSACAARGEYTLARLRGLLMLASHITPLPPATLAQTKGVEGDGQKGGMEGVGEFGQEGAALALALFFDSAGGINSVGLLRLFAAQAATLPKVSSGGLDGDSSGDYSGGLGDGLGISGELGGGLGDGLGGGSGGGLGGDSSGDYSGVLGVSSGLGDGLGGGLGGGLEWGGGSGVGLGGGAVGALSLAVGAAGASLQNAVGLAEGALKALCAQRAGLGEQATKSRVAVLLCDLERAPLAACSHSYFTLADGAEYDLSASAAAAAAADAAVAANTGRADTGAAASAAASDTGGGQGSNSNPASGDVLLAAVGAMRARRAAVESLLAAAEQAPLFKTQLLRAALEERALKNLRAELARLTE